MKIKLYRSSDDTLLETKEIDFLIKLSKSKSNFFDDSEFCNIPENMIKTMFLSDINLDKGDGILVAMVPFSEWHSVFESILES